MLRSIAFAAAALTMAATPTFAATHCRDAHGKFINCADKKIAKPIRCKNTSGKFAKCGTPGAKPIR
ncbi:hypothetical protein EAH79_01590 [Sphingomonas koreensis]|nr:hypothetical protein EAH79_01590 [Sphingomonas koreensis]